MVGSDFEIRKIFMIILKENKFVQIFIFKQWEQRILFFFIQKQLLNVVFVE